MLRILVALHITLNLHEEEIPVHDILWYTSRQVYRGERKRQGEREKEGEERGKGKKSVRILLSRRSDPLRESRKKVDGKRKT